MKNNIKVDKQIIQHDDSRYLIILADRKKTRLFIVVNGKIEKHESYMVDDVPQNVKANERDYYGRSDIIFRHIEDHLHRHLSVVAKKIQDFVAGKHIDFILIGGHKELFGKIIHHLPKRLQDKVIGKFVVELNISKDKILATAKAAIDEIQQQNDVEKMEVALKGM